jgi:hypothetical protein
LNEAARPHCFDRERRNRMALWRPRAAAYARDWLAEQRLLESDNIPARLPAFRQGLRSLWAAADLWARWVYDRYPGLTRDDNGEHPRGEEVELDIDLDIDDERGPGRGR